MCVDVYVCVVSGKNMQVDYKVYSIFHSLIPTLRVVVWKCGATSGVGTMYSTYPGVVGHKVDTDKVPSNATQDIEEGSSEPAKPLLHMSEHKECKQQ